MMEALADALSRERHHSDHHQADRDSALVAAIFHIGKIMSAIDDSIKSLTDAVAAQTTVDASAVTALSGIAQMLKDALAAAAAAGATPVQLQALTDLSASISANNAGLATAVAANTPPAPAPAPGSAPAPSPIPSPSPSPAPTPAVPGAMTQAGIGGVATKF